MAKVPASSIQPQSALASSTQSHPYLQSALATRELGDLQELQWLLREEAEEQKRSIMELLEEQHHALGATLGHMAARLERMEQQSQQAKHLSGQDFGKSLERAVARLERQGQRLEQGVENLMRQSLEQRVGGPQHKEQPWEHPLARLAACEQHLQKAVGRIEDLLEASVCRTRRSSKATTSSPLPSPTGFQTEGTADRGLAPEESEKTPQSPTQGEKPHPGRQEPDSEEEGQEVPRSRSASLTPPKPRTSSKSLGAESAQMPVDLYAFVSTQGVKGRDCTLAAEGLSGEADSGLGYWKRRLEQISPIVIVLNCIWMGVEAEVGIRAVQVGEGMPEWVSAVEMTFAFVFLMELIARLGLHGCGFFRYPYVLWNAFDTMVVLVQVADVFINMYNVSFMRSIRVARSIRLARLLRAARVLMNVPHTRSLRLLMNTVSTAVGPLTWVVLLLSAVIFLCSVAILQAIRVSLEDRPGATSAYPELFTSYGSLWSTMLTLFMAVTGGMPWGRLVEPLFGVSAITVVFVMLYVAFVMWGLLNIATAIFVERLTGVALKDDKTQVQEYVSRQNSPVNKVRESLLAYANNDGYISPEGLEDALRNPALAGHLRSINMDAWEATGLFHLLNCDVSDRVHVDDYIRGVLDMKFQSKRVDTTTLMYENKKIITRLVAFMRFTEERFDELVRAIGEDREVSALPRLGAYVAPRAAAHPSSGQA